MQVIWIYQGVSHKLVSQALQTYCINFFLIKDQFHLFISSITFWNRNVLKNLKMFVKNITRNNIDWDDKTKRAFIFYEHAKTTFLYTVEFWCMIWSLARRGEVFCKSNVVRIIYFAQMARNYMTYISFHSVLHKRRKSMRLCMKYWQNWIEYQ